MTNHRHPSRAALLLCVWLWLCGCDATGLPSGARGFAPPEQYRAWWALTEACSGLRGDFSSIKWYFVPHSDSFSLEGETVNGAWYGDPNRIVLGDEEEFDGSLVRHEMLHALLHAGKHSRQQFLQNCSDIVVCIEQCVTDAGGPPDTSDTAPILGPSLLPASILVAPDTVSFDGDSGWVTITFSITNTTNAPALEQVPTYQSMPRGVVTFRATPPYFGDIEEFLDYYVTLAPAHTAGSTRRIVFDQQIPTADTYQLFTISGAFGESVPPTTTLFAVP